MSATLPPAIKFQPLVAGVPLPGGKVYFYAAGTTTPQAVYAADGTTPLANPLILDANGAGSFRLGAGLSYKIDLFDANNVHQAGWPEDNVTDQTMADLTSTATGKGAALVGYKSPLAGAVATTLDQVNGERISVFRWFTAAQIADVIAGTASSNFTAAMDVGAAIQAAINAVHAINTGSAVDGLGTFHIGGATLYFPRGCYKTTTQLEVYAHTRIVGDGRWATVIYSSFDGAILRNHLPDTDYNVYGICIESLSIVGDRTKTGQMGIALMRAWMPIIRNVSVLNCGSDGVHIYQGVIHDFQNLEVQKCVGYGFVLDQGYSDWTLATPNNLPTIDGRCTNGHFAFNDKPGIRLQGYHDSNQFLGGSSEQNNQQTAHAGYQIECVGFTVWPDEFVDFSGESTNGFAYIYVNLGDPASIVRFTRYHHSAVAAGTLDRCANVVQGQLIMDSPYGNAQAYRSLGGFTTPFQITKATASIKLLNPIGSTVTNGVWVNDETNAVTGLTANVHLVSRAYTHGPNLHRGGFGDVVQDYQLDTESFPWMSLQSFYRGIALGGGSAAPDAMLVRSAANTLGLGSGDFIDVGSAWNGTHLLMGAYHLWVEAATGKLRIKSSAPTSDADGTVVGTQV